MTDVSYLGLAGRRALVVAASRGIGFAVAERLLCAGCDVTIASRSHERVTAAQVALESSTGVRPHVAVVDLAKPGDSTRLINEVASSWGGIDILVTNSGGPPIGSIDDLSLELWHAALQSVLISAIELITAASIYMRDAGRGAIACINSYSFKQPAARRGLSSVPRAGLAAFVKTASWELGEYGIRVNNICPGPVMTDRARELISSLADRNGTDFETEKAAVVNQIAIKRYGESRDVADLVAFVVSDRATFVTGSSLSVDGGYSLGIF